MGLIGDKAADQETSQAGEDDYSSATLEHIVTERYAKKERVGVEPQYEVIVESHEEELSSTGLSSSTSARQSTHSDSLAAAKVVLSQESDEDEEGELHFFDNYSSQEDEGDSVKYQFSEEKKDRKDPLEKKEPSKHDAETIGDSASNPDDFHIRLTEANSDSVPPPTSLARGGRRRRPATPGAIRIGGESTVDGVGAVSILSALPEIPPGNQDEGAPLVLSGELVDDIEGAHQRMEREQIEQEVSRRVVDGLTRAEQVSPEEGKPPPFWKKRPSRSVLLVMVFSLLLAVGLAIALSIVLPRNSGSDPAAGTSDSLDIPTQINPPTDEVISTSSPTLAGPTMAPQTMTPTALLSNVPSVLVLGDNSFCENAHPLNINQERNAVFTNAGATPCFLDCIYGLGFLSSGFSKWYTYVGDGRPVRLQSEGIVFQVYTPESTDSQCSWNDSCESSGVYDIRLDRFTPPITWIALEGATYYIQAICEATTCEASILSLGTGLWPFSVAIRTNEAPEAAYGPLEVTDALFLPGSFATTLRSDVNHSFPACGTSAAYRNDTETAWYAVYGTGRSMFASTCGTSIFDTQISVFTLAQEGIFDSLTCVDGNDNFCGNGQSRVEWSSVLDERYYVVVFRSPTMSSTSSDASFVVQISGDGLGDGILSNDICSTAGNLERNQSQPVFLGQATDDEGLDFACIETDYLSCAGDGMPTGLWFQVVGDGSPLTLEVDRLQFEDDFVGFSVFQLPRESGSCENAMQCFIRDCRSGCSWDSIDGTTYYVYVFHLLFPVDPDEVSALIRVF